MREESRYNESIANIYGKRIVCGICGFRIAQFENEPRSEEHRDRIITVLCRRKNKEGVSCNTVNEIYV